MKRDFLKNLGIEDKELIDKILDENSFDIGKAKGDIQTYKDKVQELTQTIKEKDSEISSLTSKVGDTESLTQQISQLQADNTNLTNELNTKVSKLQKSHAIENSVRDAKAKNVKAVMALLDIDKITLEDGALKGIQDQLESLTKGEDTAFLFGDTQPSAPAGTHLNNPPSGQNGTPPTSKTFAEAVAKAINKN